MQVPNQDTLYLLNFRMEDEDLNISMILSMGFGDIGEIKRALRLSKGDVNEAVSILMDQPNPGYLSMDTGRILYSCSLNKVI